MKNCLDCYRCWVVKDPDPKDDTCLAAFCSKSKTRGMKCNEISYLMPLGYNSAFAESPLPGDPWIAVAEHWDSLREKCNIPDWCPGMEENGEYSLFIDRTSVDIMKERQ